MNSTNIASVIALASLTFVAGCAGVSQDESAPTPEVSQAAPHPATEELDIVPCNYNPNPGFTERYSRYAVAPTFLDRAYGVVSSELPVNAAVDSAGLKSLDSASFSFVTEAQGQVTYVFCGSKNDGQSYVGFQDIAIPR